MANVIESVHLCPLTPKALQAAWFSESLLEIPDPAPILSAFGLAPGDKIYGSLPAAINDGVQNAPKGAIQDPAGSAVGGSFAGAGGASGAIYQHFNTLPDMTDHLSPIPPVCPGAAIFNGSAGAGRRVLHSHSPSLFQLGLDPRREEDRGKALTELANAYYSAIVAFNRRSSELGDDGELLNLVPLSAGIFGGAFKNHRSEWSPNTRHLDPTYTLTAVALAIAQLKAEGSAVPAMAIYYFGADVYKTAAAEVARLQGGAGIKGA